MPKIYFLKHCFVALTLNAVASVANAHYPMMIGDRSPMMEQRGGTVNLTYGLGELHNGVLVDVRKPDWVRGYTFDGGTFELTNKLEPKGKLSNIEYRSRRIGDTWIVAHVPMSWSKHDSTFTETTARTIIHQGLSRGWETPLGLPLEIVPLIQPYGLFPGEIFRFEVLLEGKPLENAKIYAEKFYKHPLIEPFPDAALLTRTSRTDGDGIATVNLHSPGWWVLFINHEMDEMEQDGKEGVATLQDAVWVYVDDKPKQFK